MRIVVSLAFLGLLLACAGGGPAEDGCAELPSGSECEGNRVRWCEDGEVEYYDCADGCEIGEDGEAECAVPAGAPVIDRAVFGQQSLFGWEVAVGEGDALVGATVRVELSVDGSVVMTCQTVIDQGDLDASCEDAGYTPPDDYAVVGGVFGDSEDCTGSVEDPSSATASVTVTSTAGTATAAAERNDVATAYCDCRNVGDADDCG